MNCPSCNNELANPNGNFCPKCGQRFIRCSTCGDIITNNAKFCPKDGTKIIYEMDDKLPTAETVAAGAAKANTARNTTRNAVNNTAGNTASDSARYSSGNTTSNTARNSSQESSAKRTASSFEQKTKKGPNYLLIGVACALVAVLLGAAGFFITSAILDNKKQKEQAAAELLDPSANQLDQNVELSNNNDDENSQASDKNDDEIVFDNVQNETEAEKETKSEKEAEPADETETVDPSDITASVKTAKASAYSGLKKAKITNSSASSVVTDNDPSIKNEAAQMVDGNEITSWQEGVSGDGIGEYAYFTLKKEYTVKYITFKLGNWRDQSRYDMNNRPKSLLLKLGGQEYTVKFPDGKKEYMVVFSDGLPASDLYLEIRSVYKGNEWDDTCISEMTIYTE